MIKKLSKLTLIMILMGAIMACSFAGCQGMTDKEEYGDWRVDWNEYRPSARPPQNGGDEGDANAGNGEGNASQGNGETQTPSNTNTATQEPILYTAMIKSNTSNLNIRSAPSSSASVLGSMDKGDMVRYEGLQNGWYKTIYKQKPAYIYAGNGYASVEYMKQASQEIEKVIAVGEELLGYPYVWGSQRYHWGNGKLNSNFVQGQYDCSALMQYIFFKGNGVLMDLNTRTQVLQGKEVKDGDLKRGDVMFFTNDSRVGKSGVERVGHVALYLGDNYILHTASDHAVIEPISNKRWSYFIIAKRFI